MYSFTSIFLIINRNNCNIHILPSRLYVRLKHQPSIIECLSFRYSNMSWDCSKLKSKLPVVISQEISSVNVKVSESFTQVAPPFDQCSNDMSVVTNGINTENLEICENSTKKRKLSDIPDACEQKVLKIDIEDDLMCELSFLDRKTMNDSNHVADNSNVDDNRLDIKSVSYPSTMCMKSIEHTRKSNSLELCGNEKSDLQSVTKKPRKKEKQRSANKNGAKESKRPTHFLAFRLKNQHIHEKATRVQEAILNINKDFKPACIPLPTLHVTLAVMTLNSKEDIANTCEALAMSLSKLKDVYDKAVCKHVEFDSLETFNSKVLFIDVKEDEGLQLLKLMVPLLKEGLHSNNISLTKEEFKPHATLMKLSRNFNKLKKKGIKRIPEELYKEQKREYFGSEELSEILLCSMSDKKTDDGFYKIIGTLDLMNNRWVADVCNNIYNPQRVMGNSISSIIQGQPKRSYHTVTVCPEMEVSDVNHSEFLYTSIVIELCVKVYRCFEYYLRKLFYYV